MNAVEVENLTFAYSGGEPVIRDVSFSVSAGELFVIAGASGSGKTTLCHILCGIIPNAIKGTLSGRISVMGIDPRDTGLPKTSIQAGLVFQDADAQIICSAVEDELAFGLENLCYPSDEIRRRVDELALEFGFAGLLHTDPARLSGGQKKLLTIAAVLAPAPPILILDEPMSGLDSSGAELVLTAINRQRHSGRTVIVVEHDLEPFVSADKWMLLSSGEAAMCGIPSAIMRENDILAELGLK